MPVECICIICGKKFMVAPYKKNTSKYCSNECRYIGKKGKKAEKWIIKQCPSCGKEFETLKSKEKKYCSQKCLKERNENYVNYNCDCCGIEMRVPKYIYQKLLDGTQKTLTCSYDCASKMKNNGNMTECDNCHKQIYRTKYRMSLNKHQFCSTECEFEFRHKEAYETRKCEICGIEFKCAKISSQRFCSNTCNSQWQKNSGWRIKP